MEDDLCILLICISCFIITCLIIELIVVNIKRLKVKQKFLELDDIFEKRLNILSKMVDIAKGYERNRFDDFGSRLYDYSKSYSEYDCNKKIEINELIESDNNSISSPDLISISLVKSPLLLTNSSTLSFKIKMFLTEPRMIANNATLANDVPNVAQINNHFHLHIQNRMVHNLIQQ